LTETCDFEREIEYKVPIAAIATITDKLHALDEGDMVVTDLSAELAIDIALGRGLEISEQIKTLVNAEKKADRGHILSMIWTDLNEFMVESGYWTAERLAFETEIVNQIRVYKV
jgi:hypothetical protein